MTTPPPTGTPSPGFDLRIETRLPPDGKPKLELDPGKRHEIVVHIPGGEAPGATVPEAGRAQGGLSLPRVGEKWSTAAPTGSASVALSAPLPPARALTPSFAIAYTAQGGNGPFGWGWRSSIPSIARVTTKAIVREHGRGLPEYDDANESDVFVFAGADELVKAGEGLDPATGGVVIRYRARTEGGFARIERHEIAGVSHFVVRSADNVLSIFGQAPEARVADPTDPKRVFEWLLQEQRDDRGNVVIYRYKAEDDLGVDAGAGSERGRTGTQAQRFLKRILYGNRKPPADGPTDLGALDDSAARDAFMFEVVFDYGEHAPRAAAQVDDDLGWPARPDAFSTGRAGFEIRTRRLCRRVLVFHRFAALGPAPLLVRSLDLEYAEDPVASRLIRARVRGYDGADVGETPPRVFTYSPRTIAPSIRTVEASALHGLDLSSDRTDAELLDLDGDGLCGLLTREAGRFVYRASGDAPGSFREPFAIPFGASPSADPSVHLQRWLDPSGRGRAALVEFGPTTATVFERDPDTGSWQAGAQVAAGNTPPVGKDPIPEQHRIYLVDLDGDGITDVLVAKAGGYRWWRRMGDDSADGWVEQPELVHAANEDDGPMSVLFDAARDLAPEGTVPTEAIVFADMTGDGLPDVVRLRADEVAYWPNLGYGRFGRKVIIGAGLGVPVDPERVRLCDVDGLGTTDVLYLGDAGATLWLNQAGNQLVAGPSLAVPAPVELGLSALTRVDGRSTASLVIAPRAVDAALTIIDLVGEPPMLLVRDDDGMGLRTTVRYGTSTEHAIAARSLGVPWRTRLPVVVHVVDSLLVEDRVRGTRFASRFRYRHGHYDAAEREFRGFAWVEQVDAEAFEGETTSAHQTTDAEHFVAPLRTRAWFCVGAGVDLSDEYDASDPHAAVLPSPEQCDAIAALGDDERRDALRALRGTLLRQETFSDDPGPDPDDDASRRPIAVVSHAGSIRVVQPKGSGHHASVLVIHEETLSYTYERQAVADPRLVQTAVLEVDDFGAPTRTAMVAYPRRTAVPEPTPTPPRVLDDPDPPEVVQARVTGFVFDEAKSFVLPAAQAGLRALADLYDASPGARVLVVGHTDREGKAADNAELSLLRARSVAQFLMGDVDAWLAMYGDDVAKEHRFGADEDAHMLGALGFADDVVGFQHAADLEEDGDLGPITRWALIERYMGLAGALLPLGTEIRIVGAGEHFPTVETEDGIATAANRRTEVFFFADAIDPAPPGELLAPGAPEYAAWVGRLARQIDIDAVTGTIVDPVGPGATEPLPPEEVDDDAISDAPPGDPQLAAVFVTNAIVRVDTVRPDAHRLGTVVEESSWEVLGKPADSRAPFPLAALRAAATGGAEIAFEATPSGAHERRLVSRTRHRFYDDASRDALPFGQVGRHALPYDVRRMAMSTGQATAMFAEVFAALREDPGATMQGAGYVLEDGGWWVSSGHTTHEPSAFFMPVAAFDPFGVKTGQLEYDDDHYLVVASIAHVAGGPSLRTDMRHDYRVLAAAAVNDPNDTTTLRRFDALGLVVAEVTRGSKAPKLGPKTLPLWKDDESPRALGDEGDDAANPTRRHAYDLLAFVERGVPVSRRMFVRLTHGDHDHRVSLAITHYDGAGNELQSKVRQDDGRFRCSGRTVVNNKGLPVLRFAPFITSSEGFDAGAAQLVATLRYDAMGRCVRTDYPDGTLERVTHDAWAVDAYDRNDTILESTWLATHTSGSAAERRAADATLPHAATPSTMRLDVLGRVVASFARSRDAAGAEVVEATRQALDVSGNVLEVIDARGNVAEKREFGMLGQVLRIRSVDGGERRAITDVSGAPLRALDGKGCVFRWAYDPQRRPTEDFVKSPGEAQVLLCKRVWGDGANDTSGEGGAPANGRHRGRLLRVYDGGGELRILSYDLDGNATATERRLTDVTRAIAEARAAKLTPHTRADWSCIADLESVTEIDAVLDVVQPFDGAVYPSSAEYDARGRVVQQVSPSGAVVRTRYTQDGLLVAADRRGTDDEVESVYSVAEFDHLGRPLEVNHGVAATSRYTYDPITERLTRLRSTAKGGKVLQDLQYTYDPVGNITQIRDGAQATVHHANAAVEAVNDYRYDGHYRLVEASGREHAGQAANARGPDEVVPLRTPSPRDPGAMRRYVQRFGYDAVGNLRSLTHEAGAGSFRRAYAYGEHGNRLRATGRSATALAERYEHDPHGNMLAMPHLDLLAWDEGDQLERVKCGTQTTWMQYAGGARIRKYVEKGDGVVEVRTYVGGEEAFTKRRAGVPVERTLTEHLPGGLRIETKTLRDGKAVAKPKALWRFGLGDQLGSVRVEVDRDGAVIGYEEFHPFGTTAYRATASSLDAAANRYRYTGMERDEETGLALHGARYYAAWLGRWTAADPSGLADGVNRFAYVGNRPIGSRDSTGLAAERPWEGMSRAKTQADYLAEQEGAPGDLLAVPGGGPKADPLASYRRGRVTDWDQWGRDVRSAADETSKNVLGGVLVLYATGAAGAIATAIAGAGLLGLSAAGAAEGFTYGSLETVRAQVESGEDVDIGAALGEGAKNAALGAVLAYFAGRGLSGFRPRTAVHAPATRSLDDAATPSVLDRASDGRPVSGHTGFLGSPRMRRAELLRYRDELAKIGIGLRCNADDVLPPNAAAGFLFDDTSGTVLLRKGATWYQAFHELTHARQYHAIGSTAYRAWGMPAREIHVFRVIWRNRSMFTSAEVRHAIWYARQVRFADPTVYIGVPSEYRGLIRQSLGQ